MSRQDPEMRLDRVILATNANPEYYGFWPLAARMWRDVVGLRPTLAVIADASLTIDETLGDVVRFEPLAGIDAGLQAQLIRLVLPAMFEHDVALVADLDLIPLNREYFTGSVGAVPDEAFVVYRDREYDPSQHRYPMCYNAARGSTFQDVFEVRTVADMRRRLAAWASRGLGWDTDEMVVYEHLHRWPAFADRSALLGHRVERRVDRGSWSYRSSMLALGWYIDAHLPRPYQQHRVDINRLASQHRPSTPRSRAAVQLLNKSIAFHHWLRDANVLKRSAG